MPRTPEETVRRLLDLLQAEDMDAIAELWATDGVAEFPFAEDATREGLVGREQIRDHLADYPKRMNVLRIPTVVVHHTSRPDTIVVEFAAHGRTVTTGEPYRLDYITVVTVREGLIVRYRDYLSPVAAASAAGTLPELLESLRSRADR
ncbi:ketosteroid isomerase-like protein [Actinoalloteichus hoggarensis]|uniref:Putative PhzA/B-like protein n=1 Tax=Actinoalloteichus hoggarensis TaxID=1470176 RepID=A0A221W3N8_9PSEU|nr:nuclear transport factor 2 family protein [Actinoalloteichus hoggarensis]ASO20445.1 putative PhzA/B-like protein [Actinoalloteichus hoggarensis]MBB5923484.1 ketosteroid isomerase-like protein [Actinoalloteichus hoggarensis]